MSGGTTGRAAARRRYALALAGVALLAAWPRAAPLLDARAHPERHFAGDVGVASADSYYWLRLAREHREGVANGARDPLRDFPDGAPRRGTPPIARSVATLADATGLGVHRAGRLLTVALALLFVAPLGAFFWRLGAPAAGIGAACVGALSPAYLERTFAYRIDTDGGNLFFVWLAPLCALGLRARARPRARLAAALATGAALRGFGAWYAQPGLVLAFLAALALHLALARVGWRAALACWLAAAAVAGAAPWQGGARDAASFARVYVLGGSDAAAATAGPEFPRVLDEIAELRRLPPGDALGALLRPAPLAALGLAGFAALARRRWRAMAMLAPSLALGLLGLALAQRFLMYLGPFVGAGLGWAFAWACARAARRAADPARARRAAPWAGALALAAALPATAFFHEPAPRVTPELLASLRALRERLPPGAAVAHSWGHGYLIQDVVGAPTFNDGGAPDPRVEQLLSAAFASPSPRALQSTLAFLAVRGRGGVDRGLAAGGYLGLVREIADAPPRELPPLALLFTEKMAREFSGTWRLATWSFERQAGQRDGYDVRHCTPEPPPSPALRCAKPGRPELHVDLESGTIDGSVPARGFVRVRAGRVVEERRWPARGPWLQLIEAPEGPPHELHVLGPGVFASTFNQMFYLGRVDAERFRWLLDDFPVARAWEVLPPR